MPVEDVNASRDRDLIAQLSKMMDIGDTTMSGRIKQLEQRIDSFMNVLGRVFDLDWNRPDDRTVLVSIRESIMFSEKLKNMKDPSFDQLVDYVRKGIKTDEARSKNTMSYVRLVVAGVLGIVFTIIATRLGLK